MGILRMRKEGLLFLCFCSMVFGDPTRNQRNRISIDDLGNGVFVWEEFSNHHFVIKSTFLTASDIGGSLSEPIALSPPGRDAFFADVKINQSQKVLAVWQTVSPDQAFVLQAAAGDLNEAEWGAIKDISVDASLPKIGIDSSGNGVIIWQRKLGNQYIVSAATYSAPTGQWGATVDISSPSRTFLFPEVAINSGGNAVAIWQYFDGRNFLIQSSYLPFGFSNWSSPITLSDSLHTASNPGIALNDSGKVLAIWQTSNGTNLIIQATTSSFGSTWDHATDLSIAGQNALNPEIVLNNSGKAVAIWQRHNGTNHIVQAATFITNWSIPSNLSLPELNATMPKVAITPSGEAAAVWQADKNGEFVIQSSFLEMGMPWSTAVDISEPGQRASLPQIGVDSTGKPVAAWQAKNNSSIQVAKSSQTINGHVILDQVTDAKDL